MSEIEVNLNVSVRWSSGAISRKADRARDERMHLLQERLSERLADGAVEALVEWFPETLPAPKEQP